MRKIDLTNFQVATSETARQINRRIALNFIRRHNPMSRADLARRSGLQRSTVSAIVDQLIDEGWVTEGAVGRAPRGRRPRFLHLNVERAGILAVELRPEVTTVGLAGVDARFVEQTSWPTPHSAEAFVRKLARTVTAMQRAHPRVVCEGMGVSLPGRVDASGRLVFAPNLRWRDIDLASLLEAAIGLPVVLEKPPMPARGRAVVRPASRAHPASARGDGLGRDRRRPARERPASARRSCDGRGVRSRHDRRAGSALSMRQAGLLGTLRVELSRRSTLRPWTKLTVGDIPRFEDLLRFAEHGDRRAVQALERMARYLGFGLAGLATGLAPRSS